ncbi:MAG: tetratricopeptide repeat protein, partial [Bacteroidota bacterium]
RMMLKAFALVVAGTAATATFAQRDKISTAEMKLTNNDLDLIAAKDAIDIAAANPISQNMPYMYLVRGKVYQRIYGSKNEQIMALSNDAAYISAAAYLNFFLSKDKKKVFEVDEAKGTFLQSAVDCYNDHIRLLNEKQYGNAIRNLETVVALLPYDEQKVLETNNLTNAKLTYAMFAAAYDMKDKGMQEKYLRKLIDLNYPDPIIYGNLADILFGQEKVEEGMQMINRGLEIKPGDAYLVRKKINFYIGRNETDKLMAEINAAIDADPESPDNTLYFYIRGNLLEQMKQVDKAIESYNKAIELNNDNYDAHWNLGVIFIAKANDLYKQVGNNGVTLKQVEAEMKKYYQEAKPHLEKADENTEYSEKDKIELKKSLKRIYDNLGIQQSTTNEFVVRYTVKGSGTSYNVTYTNADGGIEQREVPSGWSKELKTSERGVSYSLSAQNTTGSNGTVEVSISINGNTKKSQSQGGGAVALISHTTE